MNWILMLGLALWFIFGDPAGFVAKTFWPNSAAPWENVDAFYYPNKNDLTVHRAIFDLANVEACRSAVRGLAYQFDDADLAKGDYECGIGRVKSELVGMNVYRITAR